MIMSSSDCISRRCRDICRGCNKSFTKLSARISQDSTCNIEYAQSQDPQLQQRQRERKEPQQGLIDDGTSSASVAAILAAPAAALN